MDKLDLNINNYDLNEILALFNLPYNFTINDLKEAKRQALKTHPDKSGLDPAIFRFFAKAYKVVFEIYNFRKKSQQNMENVDYDKTEKMIEKNFKLLEKINKKPRKEFNSWFNDMFDKVNAGEEQRGHGNWLSSNEDLNTERASNLNDFGRIFDKRKEHVRALTVYDKIEDRMQRSGTSLNPNEDVTYSSDIFSKLKFDDVKVAYTETVVPVTQKDFQNRKQFSSVDEYSRYRGSQMPSIPTKEESHNILLSREQENEKMGSIRAYELYKQDQVNQRKNDQWWKYVSRLTNK